MFDYRTIKSDEQFHADRRKRLGASDMPVLAGLTRKYTRVIGGKKYHQTPYVLWLEKTGRIEPWGGNEYTYWGKRLEALVIDEYVKRHSLLTGFLRHKTEFIHPDYPWAMSHPDLVVRRSVTMGWPEHIEEIKTGTSWGTKRTNNPDWGYDKEDLSSAGIPAIVWVQVQWQLFTSDIQQAGVAVLSDTSCYREYGPITPSRKVVEKLLARGQEFMWYVEKDREPKPEMWTDCALIWPEVQDMAGVVGGVDEQRVVAMKNRKNELQERIKKAESEIEEMKTAIGCYLRDNKVLSGAGGDKLATQSVFIRESVALKKLEKENPALFAQLEDYISRTEVRTIRF